MLRAQNVMKATMASIVSRHVTWLVWSTANATIAELNTAVLAVIAKKDIGETIVNTYAIAW